MRAGVTLLWKNVDDASGYSRSLSTSRAGHPRSPSPGIITTLHCFYVSITCIPHHNSFRIPFLQLSHLSPRGLVWLNYIWMLLNGNDESRSNSWYNRKAQMLKPPGILSTSKRVYPYHPFFPMIFVTPESLGRAGTMHSVMS